MSDIGGILFTLAIIVGVILFLRLILGAMKRQSAGMARQMNERMEALFRTGFPELQPHYHPKNVYEYAAARMARKDRGTAFRWQNPPGFTLASEADVRPDGAREKTRLLDKAGPMLAEFVFEEHAEGAALRVGKGKLTVGLKGPEPRVRSWHPEREFKWTPRSWNMKTGVSDQPLQSSSSDHDSSGDSYSSSSSSSRTATAAAAGAGIVAAGGSFDGGGASAAWDSGDGGSSGSSSDSSSDFSSVESGSSSSSSTSY